ncbi:MAG: hypothetical protein AAGC64_07775 [Bacteroidota bacterium]
MTEIEYNILDQLYFVTSYQKLREELGYSHDQLKFNLREMIKNGLVRVYNEIDQELEQDKLDMQHSFQSYYYLASKKGLFEHNSR